MQIELPKAKVEFLVEVCLRLRSSPIVPKEAKAEAKEVQELLEKQLGET
jgi:hypothetical protein